MKKVLAALLVGLLTLALSGVARAASDRMAVDIFAKGKGTDARGGTFNFLATDLDGNPDTPATGHVSYEIGSGSTFLSFKGPVTCLCPPFTRIAGPVEQTNVPEREGKSFFILVTDTGLPNGEGDTFLLLILENTPSQACQFPTGSPTEEIREGDILVIHGRQ